MSAAAMPQLRRRIPLAAVLAALAALAFAPQSAAAAGCSNAGADPNSVSIGAVQQATLCLLNRERRAHGLRAFRENRALDSASLRHAKDMAKRHYFAHGDFVGRIRASNYLSGARSWSVGENIAWGTGSFATPAAIVDMWMHSPPHRHNILNGGFREIGIGIARGTPRSGLSDGATYATDFGSRG